MITIYLHTKFHKPSSNGSLVISVNLQDKENGTVIMLFCALQNNEFNNSCIFLEYLYNTSFKEPILSGASGLPPR
jgi:hypothetical protein